ncbi:MAG: leucyl aminopeptidase family protein [Candidatus Diapherotrites archaeon]
MKIEFNVSPKSFLEVIPVLESASKEFNGKKGKTKTMVKGSKTILFAGMGKEKDLDLNEFRKLAFIGLIKGKALELNEFSVELIDLQKFAEEKIIQALAEGALIGSYSFAKYKKQEEKFPSKLIISGKKKPKGFDSVVSKALKVNDSVSMARDLINDSSEIVNPSYLEKTAKKIFSRIRKVKVTSLGRSQLLKNKMNLFAMVGQAGLSEPKLILLEYKGNPSSKEKTLLVGKGITFDSGGLNLKPGDSMLFMKSDMAGAAVVLAIIRTANDLNLKINLIGAMACAENLIGEKAYRPGDIVKAFNGKTIEVCNTDAEGRLVLADTLSYCVKKFSPSKVIDYATLTGSCIGTFSFHVAGMISNDLELSNSMYQAGLNAYERVWELPLYEEYSNDIKSEIADLRNTSKTGEAGTIAGGAFLKEFIGDKPWVHLDIAGTAFLKKPFSYYCIGATGFGVRLSLEFISRLMEDELK